jgi:hypothetical protein
MILKLLPNFILLLIISLACSEKPKSQKVKNEIKSPAKKLILKEVEPLPEIKKNVNDVQKRETKISIQEKTNTAIKPTAKPQESKAIVKNQVVAKNQPKETPKEAYKKESFQIPTEWNDVYSDDSEWLKLYQEAQDAFLKGSDNAFSNSLTLRPSKSQIVKRFEQKLEPLFYNTPSFIAFSVERFKKSEGLDTLCRKFNLWKE